MAQLAIKGHATRGKEVIEILEMLGGKNLHNYCADCDCFYFYINDETKIIYYDWFYEFDEKDVTVLTLEEFLEKFSYKVGDKVMTDDGDKANIVDMVWDEGIDDVLYEIQTCKEVFIYPKELLQPYKEEKLEQQISVSELMEKYDNVNNPKHYTIRVPIIRVKCECGKVLEIPVECIDVIRNMPTWKGNVIKYLWREGLKEDASLSSIEKEIEDLKKAEWYLKDKIRTLEEKL